ncbi:DUF1996 domain-containing protein [Streptomyces sp. CBG31]|uniref:DUF1996 domain-containing protein n=1 Tax=Streptomyces sp. CBG31 TaxID=2762623 RepID=UPI0028F724EA|nr:DUF1996 domain-containing protein [Streptomyces sp. CBG31]
MEPTGTTFYYLGEGVRDDVIRQIQPFPRPAHRGGQREGDRPAGQHHRPLVVSARRSCRPLAELRELPAGTMLESYLDFPQCWNGTDLDSADHKSHMAYPVAGECPSTHPVPVPKLRQVLRYPVNGDPARFRLASGPGFTMHGDFFNVWPEEELAQRVRDCINAIVKCGFDGRP